MKMYHRKFCNPNYRKWFIKWLLYCNKNIISDDVLIRVLYLQRNHVGSGLKGLIYMHLHVCFHVCSVLFCHVMYGCFVCILYAYICMYLCICILCIFVYVYINVCASVQIYTFVYVCAGTHCYLYKSYLFVL